MMKIDFYKFLSISYEREVGTWFDMDWMLSEHCDIIVVLKELMVIALSEVL